MQKLQPPQVEKLKEIERINRLIGDFDETVKYIPVKESYSPKHYIKSAGKFDNWLQCFNYCQQLNIEKHPDDCFFALPNLPELKFTYQNNWNALMPVVEQINTSLCEVTIRETNRDGYGTYAGIYITGQHATWYQFYYAETERLAKERSEQKAEMERLGDTYLEDDGHGRIISGSKIVAVWNCVAKAMLWLENKKVSV